MTPDYCVRCGRQGHTADECSLSGTRVSRGTSIAYASVLLLVALLSLVGVAAQCADAFAYPNFGSFK